MPYSFSQDEPDFLIINISIFYITLFYVYGYFTRTMLICTIIHYLQRSKEEIDPLEFEL